LTLKDPDGNVIDILVTINLLDDQAYGRKTDGSSELVLLKPTPGTANIYDPSLIPVSEPVFFFERVNTINKFPDAIDFDYDKFDC